MAHFRKIDVRIWNDEKFHGLSPNGKLAFFYLLTHPNMTALGAMRGTVKGLAIELEVLPEAFQEVFDKGLAEGCEEASCIWVKNFVKYQFAESPNVIKSWAKQLDFIPECHLKEKAIQEVKALVEGYSKGFQEAYRVSFPYTVSSKQLAVSSKEKDKNLTPNGVVAEEDISDRKLLFDFGAEVLKSKGVPEKNIGALIGKMLKTVGEDGALSILGGIQAKKDDLNVVGYITAALKGKGSDVYRDLKNRYGTVEVLSNGNYNCGGRIFFPDGSGGVCV